MRRHFTLLELLVALAIVAIVATGVIAVFTSDRVEDNSKMTVTITDRAQLRDAFRKFRQNLNLLPKEGALSSGNFAIPASLNAVTYPIWFNNPANFDQVLTLPVDISNATRWTDASGKTRSWQGPYCGPRVTLDPAVPVDLAKLDALTISGTAAASKPAAPVKVILDPWGKPYLYIVPMGTNFAAAYLRSCGPDGVVNNTDDLTLDIAQ